MYDATPAVFEETGRMKLRSRYQCVICLLLCVGVVGNQLLTGCASSSLPMEPTLAPPPFPSPQWYTGPTVPDPRIALLRERYGIELYDQKCAAPCSTGIKGVMTLAGFIGVLGAPNKVYSIYEVKRFSVVLVYPDLGLLVYADRPLFPNDVYSTEMTPDMLVGRIDLFRSRSLTDMDQELSEWQGGGNTRLDRAHEWNGFGSVSR